MDYSTRGLQIRETAKQLVLEYMQSAPNCGCHSEGIKQSDIAHDCGLTWGHQLNATDNQQVFWIVGLLRELEQEGRVERNLSDTRWARWRLK